MNTKKIVYISPDFATSGISILEKIHRLNDLQDPDLMDVEHLQYFANNLGYNVNINRGELGNLAEYVTSATCPDIETEKYLRFAIRNLPFWYRIKTTHNAVKIMLYSFGLIGDISQYYTDNYLPESEGGRWVTEDINHLSYSLSGIPSNFYPTPHFIVWVNLDLSTNNLSWQYEKKNEIVNAIESVKPANTVFRKLGGYTKIPINLYCSIAVRFHSIYIKLPVDDVYGDSDHWFGSASESMSESASESKSASLSESASGSLSESASESKSPSKSESASGSLSESASGSASPSLSESASGSLSESASPSGEE